MRKLFYLVSLFSVCIFNWSCQKDPPVISTTPEIAFVSISPATVKQYQDQIMITISYKDGDGDIGENNTDNKNLFVTDGRTGVVYQFRIQQLAPDGASIAISGNLNIIIANTAITDNSPSQSVSYSVYLTDRAGHASNKVGTSSITVTQ